MQHGTRMQQLLRYGLFYGVILGLLRVANVQSLTWLGLGLTSWVFVVDKILMVGVVIWAHHIYKRHDEVGLSFKDAFVMGVIIVLVAVLINQAYMYLYITLIEPGWVDKVADMRRQLLIENEIDPARIDERVAAFRNAYTPTRMFTRGIVVPSLWDTVVLSIIGGFTRTKSSQK